MANMVDNLFMTLLAATSEASQALKFQKTFLNSIYWQHRPVVAAAYDTLNVIVPTVNQANTVDIGNGPLQPHDLNHSGYPVQLNHNYSNSFKISSWDQSRSEFDMREEYVNAELEGFMRKVNDCIASLFTAANFPAYSIIQGTGADTFNRSDIAGAWANLANVGVPSQLQTHFVTSAVAYGNMLADTNINNAYIQGEKAAVNAYQDAKLATAFGAQVEYDQQLAKFAPGKEPGVLYHPYAVAGVKQMPTRLNAPNIKEAVIDVLGFPMLVQVEASIMNQGWIVNYRTGFGVAPARRELATLLQTA